MRLFLFVAAAVTAAAQTGTTTSVVAPPSILGAPVVLTATVSPASAIGKVTFLDGFEILGTSPLSGGQATLSTQFRKSGRRSIRAVYQPTNAFSSSHADTTMVVTPAALPLSFSRRIPLPDNAGSFRDVNGDGRLDSVPLGGGGIRLQASDGTFGPAQSTNIGFARYPVGLGDFNTDGKLDLLVQDATQIFAVIGDGNGNWSSTPISAERLTLANTHYPTVTVDLNRDGKQDIAAIPNVYPTAPSVVQYYFGNGSGGFVSAGRPGAPTPVDDFNGDGIADMVATVYGQAPYPLITGCMQVLSSPAGYVEGPPCFKPNQPMPGFQITSWRGDLNGDGQNDLIAYLEGTHAELFVHYRTGPNSLGPAVSFSLPFAPKAAADLDGDGRTDFISVDGTAVLMHLNQGNEKFTTVRVGSAALAATAELTEWNGDGIPDMLTQGAVYLGTTVAPPSVIQGSNPSVLRRGVAGDFSVTVSDPKGAAHISAAGLRIGYIPVCEVEVALPSRTVRILPATAAVSSGWAVDSSCAVNADAVQVTTSGTSVTVTLSIITFPLPDAVPPVIYSRAANASGSDSGYQPTGSASFAPAPVNRRPTGSDLSITPSSGTYLLQFTANDLDGVGDVITTGVVISDSSVSLRAACVVQVLYHYSVWLLNDQATDGTSQAIPELTPASTLSNSQCTVQTGRMVRTFNSPTSVTYKVPIVFKSSFTGARVATFFAEDARGLLAPNAQQLSFTASVSPAIRPQVAVQPKNGSGAEQIFTMNFTGAPAGADLSRMYLMIAASVGAPQMCFVEFDRIANTMRVHAGSAWSAPITPGVAATAWGSRCSIDGSQAGIVPSGNTLFVRIPVSFASGFTGQKGIFALAENIAGETTNWVNQGTWRIPVAGQAALPDVVSLTPSSGSGVTRTFTAVFSHGTAGSELYLGYILFLPVPNIVWYTAQGSCLIEYNRISNGIRLINDAGDNWLGPISGVPINAAAPPLSNSQCTVNVAGARASVGANDMTVNVPVTFKPGVYRYSADVSTGSGRSWQMDRHDPNGVMAGNTVLRLETRSLRINRIFIRR